MIAGIAGPGVLDRLRNASLLQELEARNQIPDRLDLTGQRVLFIEGSSIICGEICRDVVSIGTDIDAYWVGMGGYIPDTFTDNPLRDVLDGPQYVRPVRLGASGDGDPTTQRFTEPYGTGQEGAGHAPPYDTVIIHDDSGRLNFIAPDLLGGQLPDAVNAQFAVLIFTDWPDPFTGPPLQPTYRSVVGHMAQRPLLPIPFVGAGSITHPSLADTYAAWMRAIFPYAVPPETRDPFTCSYRCAPDQLKTPFD
ncbi:hypothetical protein KUL25_06480 [Rhodobacteraceae bacterium N5(2021)]|uniref:Uncharacterized protein n=1 Tax=Gymnodinialimonas phycosphaerae TaxID=2841589 RepID=A0A975YH51_9RHOB|nr:hypothetical protein [Gymnodinialimonas phycosphaerae]MBY4892405.1 hypothetical protein [Gymnodinialimonas phycosphaerae]